MSFCAAGSRIWILLLHVPLYGCFAADACEARASALLQLVRPPPTGPCLYKEPQFTCGNGQNAGYLQNLQVKAESLTCPLCPSGSVASPVLYGVERSDGVGERVFQVLMYMANAALYNMTLGGFVFNETFDAGHKMNHSNMLETLSAYIGSNYSKFRVRVPSPRFDLCWENLSDAFAPPPKAQAGQSILAWLGCRPMPENDVFGPLDAAFLRRLRQATPVLRQPVAHFSSAGPRVAVHVRRGDIMKTLVGNGVLNRFIPDSFYLSFLQLLKPLVAPAEIHVFSSLEGKFAESDFDGYRQLGAHVHLDGPAVEDWAHMAQADVLVVAPSSFSWVAGILNSRCVLAFGSYAYAYHPKWIQLDEDFSNLRRLRTCLRKLSPSWG